MFNFSDKIPSYLLGKFQMVSTVVFTLLCALIFMLLTIPFSANAWFQIDSGVTFEFALVFCLMTIAILIISKTVMYRNRSSLDLTFFSFFVWGLLEVVLVAVLYTVVTHLADKNGIIDLAGRSFFNLLMGTFLKTVAALGLPQIIAAMYFAIQDKNNIIKLMNYSNVVSDESLLPELEKKITLFDNNGMMKLSVSASHLFYIESDDNYIKVWYSDNDGSLKQYMLRCKLKTVEETFADSDLVRCHRKYVVNMAHVALLTRQKDGYQLTLDVEGLEPIPVTKTYEAKVLAKFNSR